MTEQDETKREGSPTRPKVERYLARGTLVGRYVVIDKLGEGGMGVVYSAFDPELDRKIAIKLLQALPSSGSSGGEQAWLLREAQALARLQHPNVVAVHDVGSLPGDQVFVAMELVDGETMRQWLKARARTWREVVPILREAGAGLAAAHAAGLVHRDFKPENVLVGRDGRVRVMDFGLARLRREDDLPDLPPSTDSTKSSPLSIDLTEIGHVVGTPAYMAPEIYDGHPADARTDQFSFGVTLFEALYHQRPFDREALANSRSAPPKPKIPADKKVPARIARVALRAIAIDPAARYPSIGELVAELARDPYTTRRRAIAVSAGAVVLAGAALAVGAVTRTHEHACEGIDTRLDGVWDAAAKQKLKTAFVATKLPFAEKAYAQLETALDAYTHEWVQTATESCQATRVRRDQTEEVLSLRQDCLDERLAEVGALVKVLSEPTPQAVEKAGKMPRELDPVVACSNVRALREPNRAPPELVSKLRDLQSRLIEAKAQIIAGNYMAAGGLATSAARDAQQLGFLPAQADADIIRATALSVTQSYDEAERLFKEAALAAFAGKDDYHTIGGAIGTAMVDAESLGRPGEARVWMEIARAAAKRLGAGLDPDTNRRLYQIEGVVETENGNPLAGAAAHEKALAEAERLLGKDNPLLWEDEEVYGTTLIKAFAFEKAIPHFEHAIELRTKVVGPDHSDIAILLSNLGICYWRLRDPRAKQTFERALAIRERTFGKNSPMLVPTLDNYADYQRRADDVPGALATMTRALRLAAIVPGKQHYAYHQVLTDYGETLTLLGRYAEARKAFDDALALEVPTHSQTLPTTEMSRSELALAQKQWQDAQSFAQRSIDGFEAAGGKDNPELWRPLTDLARAKIELGKPDEAKPLLERALAIGDKLHLDRDLQPTRDALARIVK